MPFWINIIVAVLALAISGAMGIVLVPFMKKISFGQVIKENGPTWHKSKQGTPVMGGFMFIFGSLIATVVGCFILFSVRGKSGITDYIPLYKLIAGVVATLLFCLIGFVDDYIKVIKKRNLGLNSKQKLIFQFLVSAGYIFVLYLLGDTKTTIDFYFFVFDMKLFYYPFMVLVITYIVNAVNLTDGIDGLCGSVTAVAALAFTVISMLRAEYFQSVFSIALAGACVGFLIWNLHPAKIFMGDTGSMFLGGAVVTIGVAMRLHIVLVIVAIVYILEALSVVLQVISFKTTGKRIFKMSPIHHHFEMCGWGEYKIVIIFSLIGLAAGVAATILVSQTGGVMILK